MAAFRRCVIALAVLAIFAGLASAQTATMVCNLSSLNTTIRAESKTDLVSDLLMTCTGGTVNTSSTVVAPTVNFTLSLPATVTSRLLPTTGGTTGASEALLLIDDPGTASGIVPGYGNGAGVFPCTSTASGCAVYPNVVGGIAVMSNSSAALGSPTTGAPNVYQGVVNGSAITFFGVPVIPPGSTASRTFRITNVRVDASALGSGSIVGTVTVQGGAAPQFSLNQTGATLATVQSGMTVKSTGLALSNCTAQNYAYAGSVSFTENFASGFRTRVLAGGAQNSGQSNTATTQSSPGTFFSESGLINSSFASTGGANVAGLADFGTRLKAVFNNIPSGVRVFVSFTNVTGTNSTFAGNVPTPYTTPALIGSSNTTTFAELITGGEAAAEGSSAPVATPAAALTSVTGTGLPSTAYPFVELSVSGGSATAVWEVLNTNTAANETMTFAVFAIAPAQQPTGQATVNLSYAPTSGTTIPRFVDPNAASPQNSFSITQCKTTLLYPYVTSAAGFDTGLAVANTTADVFGTVAQSGTCQFTLYGTPSPAPTLAVSPTISAGTVYAFSLTGSSVNGFTGYAIAVCNFQFAHGFAFVADWSSTIQSSAMGYLALVMPYAGTTAGTRVAGNGEGLLQ